MAFQPLVPPRSTSAKKRFLPDSVQEVAKLMQHDPPSDFLVKWAGVYNKLHAGGSRIRIHAILLQRLKQEQLDTRGQINRMRVLSVGLRDRTGRRGAR